MPPGPTLRTDIVDVHVFRLLGSDPHWLQLRRTQGNLAGTWQPVMGHVEAGETAVQAALRELREETGYAPGRGLRQFWQSEIVNTYYLASLDCIMLSPGFAAQVDLACEPLLDDSHSAHRWVPMNQVQDHFIWPGHRAVMAHFQRDLLPPDQPLAKWLKLDIGNSPSR